MSDIVERLRSPANVFYEYAADDGAFLREAADEIERLRATLDQTRRFALNGEIDTIVSDEIERLREALREITTPAYEYLSDEGAARHKIKIARAALGEKE